MGCNSLANLSPFFLGDELAERGCDGSNLDPERQERRQERREQRDSDIDSQRREQLRERISARRAVSSAFGRLLRG